MLLRLPLVLVAAGTAVAFHAAPAATVRRRAPPLHAYNAEQQILTNMIGVEVEKRWGDKAGRCLDCWARYMGGETHEEADEATGAPRRESASYIEGLEATPWHAVPDWLAALQAGHADEIAAELKAQMAGEALERDGTNVWAAAADAGAEDGSEYGPEWKTLVLQDREWEPTNAALFPKTVAALKGVGAPTCEAFFAKQSPGTGIKLHSDQCNFVLTAHVTLEAEAGKAWMTVGGEKRYWETGAPLAFDTTYLHETKNDSVDADRIVLLLRYWHHGLTPEEIAAMQFIFAASADPETVLAEPIAEVKAAQAKQSEIEAAKKRVNAGREAEAGDGNRKTRRAKKRGKKPLVARTKGFAGPGGKVGGSFE